VFSGVFLSILQSQFIDCGSLRTVVSLLKRISGEGFVSKSELMLIASISDYYIFILWFEKSAAKIGLNDTPGFCVNPVQRSSAIQYFFFSVDKFTC
jgi:hypothetical protein